MPFIDPYEQKPTLEALSLRRSNHSTRRARRAKCLGEVGSGGFRYFGGTGTFLGSSLQRNYLGVYFRGPFFS